jgi:gluconokinase
MRTEHPTSPVSIVFLIGVSGSGKTTVGMHLATILGWEFHDADAFHPPENIEKMAHGVPLTDSDRDAWLDAIVALSHELRRTERKAVIACSALKQRYRDRLAIDDTVRFVLLKGAPDLLRDRIEGREHHFMPASLLESQLDALEPAGPNVLQLDVDASVNALVGQIRDELEL